MFHVVKNNFSKNRFCSVVRERSNNAVVSAVESYSSDEASSSGVEASLRARGVMREVRPSNESRKGMKEAAGLGEANMSASMILRLTEMT